MNETTQSLIAAAKAKSRADRTHGEKILILLSSGEWVSAAELAQITHKFSSRLSELHHHKGVDYEFRPVPDRPKGTNWTEYRLAPKVAA